MNRNQNRSWTKAVKVFKLQALQKQHRKATAEFCKEPPMHSCPGKKVNKSCGSNSSCITRSAVQSPVLKDRRACSLLHMGYSDWTDPTPKWFQMGQGSQRVAVILSYSFLLFLSLFCPSVTRAMPHFILPLDWTASLGLILAYPPWMGFSPN